MQVYKSKRYRPGKGKKRNRRYKQKLGPLIVYDQDNGIVKAFRNIPGQSFIIVQRKRNGEQGLLSGIEDRKEDVSRPKMLPHVH